MNCPACNRPLTLGTAFSSTKGDNGKRLVYEYRYMTCGEHAWQTAEQRAVQIQTITAQTCPAQKSNLQNDKHSKHS